MHVLLSEQVRGYRGSLEQLEKNLRNRAEVTAVNDTDGACAECGVMGTQMEE